MPNAWIESYQQTNETEILDNEGVKIHDYISCEQGAGVEVDKNTHPELWEKLTPVYGDISGLLFPNESVNYVEFAEASDEVGLTGRVDTGTQDYSGEMMYTDSGISFDAPIGLDFTLAIELERADAILSSPVFSMEGVPEGATGTQRYSIRIDTQTKAIQFRCITNVGSGTLDSQSPNDFYGQGHGKLILVVDYHAGLAGCHVYNTTTKQWYDRIREFPMFAVNKISVADNPQAPNTPSHARKMMIWAGVKDSRELVSQEIFKYVPDMPRVAGSPAPWQVIADAS